MRLWQRAIAALLLVAGQGASADPAPAILAADYAEPTTRYTHGILGDAVEWGALRPRVKDCADCTPRQILLRLPQHRVFEDVAPRVVELGTGTPLVMVVESDLSQGARLAIYDAAGLVTATPFIGTRNRWLAPIGAADLDGDGRRDLIVGAPMADGAAPRSGAVFVFRWRAAHDGAQRLAYWYRFGQAH